MNETQRLIRQRAAYRGKITRIQTFLHEFDETQHNIEDIKARSEYLNSVWLKLQEIQDDIEISQEDETDNTGTEIENLYFSVKAQLQTLLSEQQRKHPPPGPNESSKVSTSAHIKLPAIQLPSFEGDYKQWLPYEDTFRSLIHNNEDIATVQKLQYLRASLRGEALKLIENLPITEANYSVAWQLLSDRYSNHTLIAASYIHEILNIRQVQRESSGELREFVNTASSNMNALQAMKTNGHPHSAHRVAFRQ